MSLGDLKRAEELIGKAFNDEGKSADPDALKTATIVALSQNRRDKVDEYLNKLDRVANLSSSDKAWVNRIRVALLLNKGRLADQDQALGLVEQNLKNDPNSIEDQQLKATLLALRPGRRDEAVKILEQLGAANLLDANGRFLLAQLYVDDPHEEKYQSEMVRLLNLKVRNPQHLAHFVNYWIGRDQLDQADRWHSELKKADPQGCAALELEARLLDLRKRKPELLALLEARAAGPRPDWSRRRPLESLRVREGGRDRLQGVHRPRPQATGTSPCPCPVPCPPGSCRRGNRDPEESLDDLHAREGRRSLSGVVRRTIRWRRYATAGGSLGGLGGAEAA